MEPRWIELGSLRFPVLETGSPDGPPAVLIPGLTDGLLPVTSPATRKLLEGAPLPMERFHCFMISHRHPATGVLTTRELAQDVGALLEHLLEQPAWLFAHSMGAMVAQHLAVDRPDLVAGLALSATLARADDTFREVLARWEALVRAHRWREFSRDAIRSSYTGEERKRRLLALRMSAVPTYADELVERHLALTTACATHDASDRLGRIGCPTLVMAGSRDEVCPLRHAEELAEAIPRARLEVFEDLGHGFPEQVPARFTRTVLRFIQNVST